MSDRKIVEAKNYKQSKNQGLNKATYDNTKAMLPKSRPTLHKMTGVPAYNADFEYKTETNENLIRNIEKALDEEVANTSTIYSRKFESQVTAKAQETQEHKEQLRKTVSISQCLQLSQPQPLKRRSSKNSR